VVFLDICVDFVVNHRTINIKNLSKKQNIQKLSLIMSYILDLECHVVTKFRELCRYDHIYLYLFFKHGFIITIYLLF